MAWNGWGEGLNPDYTKPPWVGGVMTLTHEEVLHVIEVTSQIIEEYQEANNGATPPDSEYVVPEYNKKDWAYCINGDTYAVIKGYDPAVNTLGIDASGIVQPVEEPVEEPVPTEGV
jgi:hypothetical protein